MGYIYKLCIDGISEYGIADQLERDKILKPTEYWKSKGIRKPGKKASFKDSPYYWCKSTVNKILNSREYMGDVVNFKTYFKSFKNKRRYENPEENHAIFEGVHEAIIDCQTWEMVQRIREGNKRRQPKKHRKTHVCGFAVLCRLWAQAFFQCEPPQHGVEIL